MTSQIRLASVTLLLLGAGLVLNGWHKIGPATPAAFDFAVPAEVGVWRATGEQRLDARSASILEPSAYVLRRYEASGRSTLYLYTAFYEDRADTAKGAHDPEICYPSSGWEQVDAESLTLAVRSPGASETLRAKLLDMRRGRDQELVLYWFQPAERWPGGEIAEELRYVWDAVAGRPQYAFVRVVGAVESEDEAERARIRADLEAFASELAWPVRRALRETPSVGSSANAEAGRARASSS